MKIEFPLHRITFMLLLATQHNIHSTLLISPEDSHFHCPPLVSFLGLLYFSRLMTHFHTF